MIGVIGGSGLYAIPSLEVSEEVHVSTPFGDPSDAILRGQIGGADVAFLARHGRKHSLLPTELNYRANIWAMKSLGVDTLLSASAVGSMKERYAPTDVVFPHQLIDRTRHRVDTFFGDGVVAHVSLADPICVAVSASFADAARGAGATVHEGGTYLCMEGPQFSTRAESQLYRSWDVDVIGMTNMQEARLAREAEICYASMCMVTDYDCWHQSEAAVNVEQVLEYLRRNAAMAAETIATVVPRLATMSRDCTCREALAFALLTPLESIVEDRRKQLEPILNRLVQSRS